MTAKKTAATKPDNPFEEKPDEEGKTLPKTTEDETGSSLPVDDTKDSEPSSEPKVEPAAPVGNPDKDPKPKRKRRTKAEIEAEKATEGETSDVDFNQVDYEKYPLSSISGQVVGSISVNSGAVPVISIAGMNWIGEAPIAFAASQLGDIEKVIKDLKKQAKATVRKD